MVSIGDSMPENAQLCTISDDSVERRNPSDTEKVNIVAISRKNTVDELNRKEASQLIDLLK